MKRRLRNLIGWALGYFACPNCQQTMWRNLEDGWTTHEEWAEGNMSGGHNDCNHCGWCKRPDRLVWL